jgi:hypothetical protein
MVWNKAIRVLAVIAFALALSLFAGEPPARGIDLGSLLEKAAVYCQKLESAALDFVCGEEIRETIDASLDDPRRIHGLQVLHRRGRNKINLEKLTFGLPHFILIEGVWKEGGGLA